MASVSNQMATTAMASAGIAGANYVASGRGLGRVSLASAFGLPRISYLSRGAACASSVAISAKMGAEQNGPVAADRMSRREMTGLVVAAVAAALAVSPSAEAMSVEERYTAETTEVIGKIRYTLGLEKTDPGKVQAVETLKTLSVDWVAKYRREKKVAGKPSFSNMYSVLNAISGHYNSFGAGYPIPAKRQVRILEEVSDAERALSRGR